MDHSGQDRELINSPLACWESRQGELSASSVSGRVRAQLSHEGGRTPAGLELCESGPSAPRAPFPSATHTHTHVTNCPAN